MFSDEEIIKILFNDKFFEGGNGTNEDAYKAPYSNRNPKPYSEAMRFRYVCGLIPMNRVLVDYDDQAAFDCRLKIAIARKEHCVVIKSPNRGGHFYYDNVNRIISKSVDHKKTLLTLHPTDYKPGIKLVESSGEIKAAKNCGCISMPDGSMRKILYANIREDGTLDEIPFYDVPLKSEVKYEFLNMGVGDGRNNDFFSYMNPIKAEGYSYEQYLEIADLINRFLLSKPLEADEFDTVTRREAWDSVKAIDTSKFYSRKGQFLHNKFGDYLMEKYHIQRINGYLHTYQSGIYLPGYEPIERLMVKEIETLTRTKRNEVLDYIRIKANDSQAASPLLIAFKNGLFNVERNELLDFSPEQTVTNLIPWEYNPGAICPLVDDVLDRLSCGDPEIRALLEEVGGMCLYRDNTIGGGKAVILIGEKSNGKSTFIFMLQSMLGDSNVSNLDFKDLDSKFSTVMLFGKLANLGDDISDSYKEDVATFKKIVTGEPVKAEEKGKPPFNFRPYVKLIFSANNIPRMNDSTGAALRRLLIIPLNAHFNEADSGYDPQIRYKLAETEAVQYFIRLSIQGLQRVLERKKFTIPSKVQQEKEAYEKENNPVLSFIEGCRNDSGEIEGIYNEPTKEVFKRYEVFCAENGFRPMSNLTFSKRINQALGTIVVPLRFDGKQKKAFVKP